MIIAPADHAAIQAEICALEAQLDRADDNSQVTRLRTLLAIRRVELDKMDRRKARRSTRRSAKTKRPSGASP